MLEKRLFERLFQARLSDAQTNLLEAGKDSFASSWGQPRRKLAGI
jgi:hypothetical protein